MPAEIRIRGLQGIPEIRPGDDLCRTILEATAGQGRPEIEPGALFVVAQKIVSKAEGRIIRLDGVAPSPQAEAWASECGRDARLVEVILRETRRIVRMDRGILIAETHHGYVCANAGVDASNAPPGCVILLPLDPDASARRLRDGLTKALSRPVGVIVSDTFGRPWRQGLTNIALGLAGLSPFIDYRGKVDCYGRTLHTTLLAAADEIAAAAELVMGKTLGIPVALVEGLEYSPAEGSGIELLRPPEEDLFR